MHLSDIEILIKDKQALLLYFQNDGCAPCVSLRPKVEEMVKSGFPEMHLKFIDAATNPSITAHFGIYGFPTLLVFFDGKEFRRLSKYVSIPQLKEAIERPYQLLTGEA